MKELKEIFGSMRPPPRLDCALQSSKNRIVFCDRTFRRDWWKIFFREEALVIEDESGKAFKFTTEDEFWQHLWRDFDIGRGEYTDLDLIVKQVQESLVLPPGMCAEVEKDKAALRLWKTVGKDKWSVTIKPTDKGGFVADAPGVVCWSLEDLWRLLEIFGIGITYNTETQTHYVALVDVNDTAWAGGTGDTQEEARKAALTEFLTTNTKCGINFESLRCKDITHAEYCAIREGQGWKEAAKGYDCPEPKAKFSLVEELAFLDQVLAHVRRAVDNHEEWARLAKCSTLAWLPEETRQRRGALIADRLSQIHNERHLLESALKESQWTEGYSGGW